MREEAGRILPSELEVMRILWERGEPMGQAELIRLLGEKRGLKEPTVKTFVRDLKLKGAIRLVSRGVYEAVVTEREYNECSTDRFIGRLFDGSARKLVASLVSDGKLTAEDLEELYNEFHGGGHD